MKEPGNDETVLLHFSAGPPYEDIAFRIVNREWEYSHKRCVPWVGDISFQSDEPNSGFRSSFDRGCLSLWFNFRRNVSVYSSYIMPRSVHLTFLCSSTASNSAP